MVWFGAHGGGGAAYRQPLYPRHEYARFPVVIRRAGDRVRRAVGLFPHPGEENPKPIEGIDYYIDNENRRIELVNGKPILPEEMPEPAPVDGEDPEKQVEQEAHEDGNQD